MDLDRTTADAFARPTVGGTAAGLALVDPHRKRSVLTRIAATVLSVFVVAFVAGAFGQAVHEANHSGHSDHSGGASCPDADADGAPCGPTCPCTCCPGHSGAAVIVSHATEFSTLTTAVACGSVVIDLDPKDIPFPIFHPPRA
jgi:hypothetical protein